MTRGRRRFRTFGLAGLLLAGGLGLFVALWTWTREGAALPPDDGPGVPVRVLDNGFHSDLSVPRSALVARGGPLADAVRTLEPGDWVLVGWGDARFYVATTPIQNRLPDGARAFFARGNRSVVMLYPVTGDAADRLAQEDVRRFVVSDAAFEAMAARIERSLDLRSGEARIGAVRDGDGDYGDAARFFASTEHFWIGHLCNHWVSQVLHAGGLSIRPARSAFSDEVVAAVDRAKLDTKGPRD